MEEKVDMGFMKKKREKVEEREKWKLREKNIELKKLISRGSLGIVYRGVYHNGDKSIDVVVKVFDWGEESKETSATASSRKAFLQEVSICSDLEHPNIAKMIGAIYNEARHYGEIRRLENNGLIVMEYIPRGTLKSYLIEHVKTKLAFDMVVKFALGVARGLSYLHSKKIVHRDVRLENVLLDDELTVKLTNFKVARFEHGPNQDEDLKTENIFHDYELDVETTVSGVSHTEADSNQNKMTGVAGTIGYMAPEVLEEKPYDHKCDVYSFGICLWEIYCCEESFPNIDCSYGTPGFIYELVRPRIPRCCPKALGMVMVKCWDSDPKRRPEMREVVSMLEAIDVSKGRGMTQDESPSWFSCLRRA